MNYGRCVSQNAKNQKNTSETALNTASADIHTLKLAYQLEMCCVKQARECIHHFEHESTGKGVEKPCPMFALSIFLKTLWLGGVCLEWGALEIL